MTKVLLLVHGMGEHPRGWSKGIVDTLDTVAARYPAFQGGGKFSERVDRIEEINYDDVFANVVAGWNQDASALDAWSTQQNRPLPKVVDRVSGWYKRQTQFYLFAIGIVLAGTMNVNTITIANHLWKDKAAREALTRRAEILKADTIVQRMLRDSVLNAAQAKRVSAELAALDLPIGWDRQVWPAADVNPIPPYLHIFFGLLITGLAVTLGAPFWFDALNKVMVIRSTVKPREKSQEESSEDRQTDKKGQVVVNMPGSTPPAPPPPAPPSAPPTPPPDFTPREWAFGDPNEGLL